MNLLQTSNWQDNLNKILGVWSLGKERHSASYNKIKKFGTK